MIELIFIIILIGILASIAIGKLATTRDDAKLSTDVSNMSICITDASARYTATGSDFNVSESSNACDYVQCYDFNDVLVNGDFNVTTNATREFYCTDIVNVGDHLAKNYKFGQRKVVR